MFFFLYSMLSHSLTFTITMNASASVPTLAWLTMIFRITVMYLFRTMISHPVKPEYWVIWVVFKFCIKRESHVRYVCEINSITGSSMMFMKFDGRVITSPTCVLIIMCPFRWYKWCRLWWVWNDRWWRRRWRNIKRMNCQRSSTCCSTRRRKKQVRCTTVCFHRILAISILDEGQP